MHKIKMTAKKLIPHRTTPRFVRKSVLLFAAMASALGVIAAQTAIAGSAFVVPPEDKKGQNGWFSVPKISGPNVYKNSSVPNMYGL